MSESLDVDRRFERAVKVIMNQALVWPQSVTLENPIPEALWVENEAAFLHQGRGINAYIRGKVELSEVNFEPIILACSTMDTPICAIWDSHDPWWAESDTFLNISNERTDFVAADYLRALIPYQELSSKAVKNFEVPGANRVISISTELKECISNEGELCFIWHINALPQQRVGHEDRRVTISTQR
ncbi:hypothetical protein RRF57_001547 [Xylaria bambusicola]|uniref:Uncharacterized protein n=1 Tax=Xylaria bambusicola TaxID=326684 RepID=A0AAN7UHE7_9PEZI